MNYILIIFLQKYFMHKFFFVFAIANKNYKKLIKTIKIIYFNNIKNIFLIITTLN